jgi:hypothetical protein
MNEKELENFKKKVRDAIIDMMSRVTMDKQHRYHRVADDAAMAGVSSVSSVVPKDWLAAWGAKEAVKFLGYSDFEEDTAIAVKMKSKIDKCKTIKDYQKILKEAKGASSRKSKEALIDGTKGHKWIEDYVKAKIRGNELPDIPYDGMLRRPLEQFVDWETKNVKLWILSEARVCDVEKEYAGTLDGLAVMRDCSKALIDYKFSSHISPEHHLQTAGYQATFEKYGIKLDKRIIIRLPKTLFMQQWDKDTYSYKIVENSIEVKEVDTPYEFDRDSFYHALPLKKWINYVINIYNK